MPVQNYWTDTKKREDRTPSHTIWVTTCLNVKDYLKGDYLLSTLKKFENDYDTDKSFANFYWPKYPDISYSVYGLIKHGYQDRALGVIEASLRDVVRAHAVFAEQYIGSDFKPDGVYPSLFGSSIIIDFVLMINGYMYGDGMPKGILLQNNGGGVSNIMLENKCYDLKVSPANNQILFGIKGKLKSLKARENLNVLK